MDPSPRELHTKDVLLLCAALMDPTVIAADVDRLMCAVTASIRKTQTRGHLWVGQRLDGATFDVFIPTGSHPTVAYLTIKNFSNPIPLPELMKLGAWLLGHAPHTACPGCHRLPEPSTYCSRCGSSALTVWDAGSFECRACGHKWVQ